jgi:hypothetical protein
MADANNMVDFSKNRQCKCSHMIIHHTMPMKEANITAVTKPAPTSSAVVAGEIVTTLPVDVPAA